MSLTLFVRFPNGEIVQINNLTETENFFHLFGKLEETVLFKQFFGEFEVREENYLLWAQRGWTFFPLDNAKPISDLGDQGKSDSTPLLITFNHKLPLRSHLNMAPHPVCYQNEPTKPGKSFKVVNKSNPVSASRPESSEQSCPPRPEPRGVFLWPDSEFSGNAKAWSRTLYQEKAGELFFAPTYHPISVSEEVSTLQPFIKMNVFDRYSLMKIHDVEFQVGLSFASNTSDIPDFILFKKIAASEGRGDENLKVACVEVKGKWTLHWIDIASHYVRGTVGDFLDAAVNQLFGQMVKEKVYYGIITSYHRWFFVARNETDDLFVTRMFTRLSKKPSLMEALAYFCEVATTKPIGLSVPDHPDNFSYLDNFRFEFDEDDSEDRGPQREYGGLGPKTRSASKLSPSGEQIASNDQLVESPSSSGNTRSPADQEIQEVAIIDCQAMKHITTMNADVFLANYKNEEIVIKAIDLSDQGLLNEMKHEIQVYKDLFHLQGVIIPELKVYGTLTDGRYAIGLSYCGKPPEWNVETKKQALDTLFKFHKEGMYVHRDVKPDQFVQREDGRIFLLDFGRSRPAITGGDFQTMHEEDCRLHTLLFM